MNTSSIKFKRRLPDTKIRIWECFRLSGLLLVIERVRLRDSQYYLKTSVTQGCNLHRKVEWKGYKA